MSRGFEHVMDPAALERFVADRFPAAHDFATTIAASDGKVRIRLANPSEIHLRPGNTVSGPTLMALADTAAYYNILSLLGPIALAVTTSLHIDFFRKPELGTIEAESSVLKLGRRLAVLSVDLLADDTLVARASVTYSIPPTGRRG